MSKIAVTITTYALIPADEFELRLGEILSELERGLQQAEADYVSPVVARGIPAHMSDAL